MTKDFEFTYKGNKATFVPENVLWCAWTINDLNNNGEVEITEEQFQEFVHQCNDGFAEVCSEYAHDMFSKFCTDNKIKQYEDDEFD